MSFFESLLALLLGAIVLSQVARRISIPYPSMLAAAGLAVAFVPGAPTIRLDPMTALALFIAPALVDAAFDFPLAALRKLWRPLALLVVVAVVLSTASVAAIGWAVAGLPLAAAITLGAIVSPPDAQAASAILSRAALPRRTVEVLKGESLLNDGSALLLFSAAMAIQANGGLDAHVAVELSLAAPGGILLGVVLGRLYLKLRPLVMGTLGGNLLEFVNTFALWLIAEHLHLSPVLTVVAFAMSIARTTATASRPDVRIHSYAVWGSVVFLLNVLAFLLMGMQARTILGGMSAARLTEAAEFAGLVIAAVVATRMVTVLVYNRLAVRFLALRGDVGRATLAQGLLVGWCGMRGLVTLATAFALPDSFPQRDLIVLTAFAVVIATLVLQGLTLHPLIGWLGLSATDEREDEVADARRLLADAGLAALEGAEGKPASHVRHRFELERGATGERDEEQARRLEGWNAIQLRAIDAQRQRLSELRDDNKVSADAFALLQQELDYKELAVRPSEETGMDES